MSAGVRLPGHAVFERELVLLAILDDRGRFTEDALQRIPGADLDFVLRRDESHDAQTVRTII